MAHDPMCPLFDMSKWKPYRGINCQCDLIARVREDERVKRDTPIQGEHHALCFPAIRDVRIGGWGPSCFTCQTLLIAEGRGYAAALSDARNAVVEVHRKWGYPKQLIDSNVIVAAIEALRGER